MNESTNPLPALGRILLALVFVVAGAAKLGAVSATSAAMAHHGIPYSNILVWGAIALELGGGIALILGLMTRFVSMLFFFYLLTLAVIFHAYWTMTGAAAHAQHTVFFEHLAMMGGMIYVAAFGSGPYSIDAMIWRRRLVPQLAQ
jgi:putative oxidoreductase